MYNKLNLQMKKKCSQNQKKGQCDTCITIGLLSPIFIFCFKFLDKVLNTVLNEKCEEWTEKRTE